MPARMMNTEKCTFLSSNFTNTQALISNRFNFGILFSITAEQRSLPAAVWIALLKGTAFKLLEVFKHLRTEQIQQRGGNWNISTQQKTIFSH